MSEEFPDNSNARRESRPARPQSDRTPERRDVPRIVKGKATLRKKPLWKKFIDAFRPEDNVGFAEYTLLEVIAPGIKDVFADSVHGAVDNALGGGGGYRRRGSTHRSRDGYTNYNRMGGSRSRGRREDDRRESRRETRTGDDAREVVLDSRVEAEEVLDTLIELSSKYGAATMRDLLSMIGEPHNPTHEDWGWTDLRGARIHRVGRDGYLLDLPRPEFLD